MVVLCVLTPGVCVVGVMGIVLLSLPVFIYLGGGVPRKWPGTTPGQLNMLTRGGIPDMELIGEGL